MKQKSSQTHKTNHLVFEKNKKKMSKKGVRHSIAKKKNILCNSCEYEIKEDSDDFIQCDKCGKNFHSQCSNLSKKEFERLLKNENEMFMCQFCKDGNGEIKRELNTIKKELKKLEKLEMLDQLTESISFMSAKFDEVFKDVAENKKKISEIEKENKKLKTEIQTLKSSVKILNDNRVKNDCIISGLEAVDGTNAVDAVVKLSKDVGIDLEPNAVEDAYFLKNKRQSNKGKTLVVKFSSKVHKDKLMSSKSKLKEKESTSDVFVRDYHSKETMNLFHHAKSLKTIGYQHVYARNGKVFCRKSDISKQQIIRCEEDVDNMLMEATTSKHWQRRSMVHSREVEAAVSSDEGDDGAAYESPS